MQNQKNKQIKGQSNKHKKANQKQTLKTEIKLYLLYYPNSLLHLFYLWNSGKINGTDRQPCSGLIPVYIGSLTSALYNIYLLTRSFTEIYITIRTILFFHLFAVNQQRICL